MLRRARPLIATATFLLAGWLAAAASPPAKVANTAGAAPPSAAASNTKGGPQYMGAGSCSASACHGGSLADENWKGAYSIWIKFDKHADAYSVLFEKASVDIAARLNKSRPLKDAVPAHQDKRCLACHAIDSQLPAGDPLLSDGISCEACHGAAGPWIAAHTSRTWNASSRAKYRMNETEDMASRATLCAECHIGAPARDGHLERNMDHDLIAAGHPRLTFEFASYLAHMPRHWEYRKGVPNGESVEASAWAIGQVVSARTALNLLGTRAEVDKKTSKPTHVWPEFSEYDCYRCHHDLKAESYRRDLSLGGSSGMYALSDWYYFGPRLLTKTSDLASVDSLKNTMSSQLLPDRAGVQKLAQASAAICDELVQSHRPEEIDPLLSKIADAGGSGKLTNWDQAAQWYLAVVALHNAKLELARGKLSEKDKQIKQALDALRKSLMFDNADAANAESKRFDSPRIFDPQGEEYNRQVNNVLMLLHREHVSHE